MDAKVYPVEIPSFSNDALVAMDVFYSGFNDIDIYVEDADQENLYEVLLRRILPELKIVKIFPQGGKPNVIKHATSNKTNNRNIYVLDKDFDDFLNSKIEDDPRIIYLDRFCIENYFLEVPALIEFAVECKPKISREEISQTLEIEQIIAKLEPCLRKLFVHYFIAQKFNLDEKNCDYAPEEFSINQQELFKLCDKKIHNYTEKIKLSARRRKVKLDFENLQKEKVVGELYRAEMHSVISGKYLLKYIGHYIKKQLSIGGDNFDSIRYRVAKSCKLTSLSEFSQSIRDYCAFAGVGK